MQSYARLVSNKALATIALICLVFGQTDTMGQTTHSFGRDSQQSVGSSKNPQAATWPIDGSQISEIRQCKHCDFCPTTGRCICLNNLICKANNCSANYAVFFTAKWCINCRQMYSTINKLRDEGKIVYVLDVDDFPESAKLANAHTIPMIIIMDEGKEKKRFVGITSKDNLDKVLKPKQKQRDKVVPDYNLG